MGIKVVDEIHCNKVSGPAGHQQTESYNSSFLGRNLDHCTRKLKAAACTIFVRPRVLSMHLAPGALTPSAISASCNRSSTVVHASSLVILGQQSSVSSMLEDRKWSALEERRYQSRLAMMFKIHRNRVVNSAVCTMSFFLRTIRDWNNLQPSIQVFIQHCKYLYLPTCHVTLL